MSRTVPALAAVALLALTPALAACGSGDDEAATVAESAIHALGGYDGNALCSLQATQDGTKPLKSDQKAFDACVAKVDKYQETDSRGYLKPLADAKVKKATAEGDNGHVQLTDIEGLDRTTTAMLAADLDTAEARMELKKIDGSWYVLPAKAPESSTATVNPGALPTGGATATGTPAPATTAPATKPPAPAGKTTAPAARTS